MPLIIDLKPGDKVIVNGAVIENAGSSTKLRVFNRANILKQKEIMTDADARTPASRVYFCLQCAYIFPSERKKYVELFGDYLTQYVEACPSAEPIAREVIESASEGNFYKALRGARKLMKHESELLEQINGGFEGGPAAP